MVAVPSAFALVRSAPAATPAVAPDVPSAYVSVRSQDASLAIDTNPAVPSAVVQAPNVVTISAAPPVPAATVAFVTGQDPIPRVLYRFQWWDGSKWQKTVPQVWDGTSWVAIPVTVTPSII